MSHDDMPRKQPTTPEDGAASPRTPKLRKLPPRPGAKAKASSDRNDPAPATRGGVSLQIIKYAYPIAGVLLILGIFLLGRYATSSSAPGDTSNAKSAGKSGNLFVTELESLRPADPVREKPAAASKSKGAKSTPDSEKADIAKASGEAAPADLTQILKLLKSVKKPTTKGKDLAALRKLMEAIKHKKGGTKLQDLGQLHDLLKTMGGKAAPAADASKLQALLSQLEQKGDALNPRDVDQLRNLLNQTTGRNAPVNPNDPQAVKDLLGQIAPDPNSIKPEEVDKLQQVLKQVSSKDGPVDLGDVQQLRDVLAASGGQKSPADLEAAGQLSAVLQDATGKPPSKSLDYLAKLQDGASDGGAPALGISQLSSLKDALTNSTSDQPAIQLGDLNNFANLIKERTGPDGKINVDDANEVIEVLKDLTGKKSSAYVDFLSTVVNGNENLAGAQAAVDLDDVNQVDSILTKFAGPGGQQKLQNLDPAAAQQLGDLMKELTGKSPDPGDPQVAQLSALIQKTTGSPANVQASDVAQLGDLLQQMSQKLDVSPDVANAALSGLPGDPAAAGGTGGAAGTQTAMAGRVAPPGSDAIESKTATSKRVAPTRTKSLSIPGLTTLTVDPDSRDAKAFKTLNDALAKLPEAGALILLNGEGPFPLNSTRIENKRRVVIASTGDNRPIISLGQGISLGPVVSPGSAGSSAALQVAQGALELRGVHLVADALQSPTSSTTAMVAVSGGDLSVSDCSFTLTGTPSGTGTTVALTVEGRKTAPPDAPLPPAPRVRIENTLVRGDGLTALRLDIEQADVDARNSLFVTGHAPGLRIDNRERDNAQAERTLRFSTTTFCCRENAISLAAGVKPEDPIPTTLVFVDSLVAEGTGSKGQGGKGTGVLLAIKDWPREAANGPYRNLNWRSQGTVYLGWNELVHTMQGGTVKEAGGTPVARSHREWLTLWKEPVDAVSFAAGAWPRNPIAKPAEFEPSRLTPETLAGILPKGLEGSLRGCPVNLLHTPLKHSTAPVRLWADRPEFPKNLFPAPASTVNIDLTTQDLGRLISTGNWLDGTLFVVSGFGIRQSTPIAISGKSLRIRFVQTQGDPLVIVPRFVTPKNAPKGPAAVDDSFVSIRNGGLEIVDGVFGLSSYEQHGVIVLPRWFVQVIDGNLSLRHCRIKGPLTGTTRNKGLIQWVRTLGGSSGRGDEGPFKEQACIVDTFLSGNGTLIEADVRQRALFIHNSVAVGSHVLALNLSGTDSNIAAAVDMQHCTLSTLDTLFDLRANKLSVETTRPLQIFSDHCVFAGPFKTGAKGGGRSCTLLKYAAPALAQRQVVWREYANGYSADIQNFLHDAAVKTPPEHQEFTAVWGGAWGADQVQKPLATQDGVRLKAELPRRDHVDAIHFELNSECPAAAWGNDGAPLGADIAKIVSPLPAPPAAKASPSKGGPPQPGRGKPSSAPAF